MREDNGPRKTDLIQDMREGIDYWLLKFPSDQKQSAVIGALTCVQEKNGGYLTQELIERVAEYLDIPMISVLEVASFYSMFDLKPVGRHKINVCSNISCLLCDCQGILDYLQKKLGIRVGETSKDGKFTLKEVECLAACGQAPVMQIGKRYYENLTPEKIDKILSELD